MRKMILRMGLGAALLALALGAGCSSDDGDDTSYDPAVEISGTWDMLLDGDPLGVMTVAVTDKGILSGSLVTTEGAEAVLDGVMDAYVAEFTMVFPAEAYLATLTFNENATSTSGVLVDHNGFQRVLRGTPRFNE